MGDHSDTRGLVSFEHLCEVLPVVYQPGYLERAARLAGRTVECDPPQEVLVLSAYGTWRRGLLHRWRFDRGYAEWVGEVTVDTPASELRPAPKRREAPHRRPGG